MTKVINIFSGPGTGKSTAGAEIFVLLKKRGISAEIVRELAADLVREEAFKSLQDLPYMFAAQNHRLHILQGKVDYAIVDSPILLPSMYSRIFDAQSNALDNLSLNVFSQYDNVNFFLKRNDSWYNNDGRYQTLEEAKNLDKAVYRFLTDNKIPFIEVDSPDELVKEFKQHEGL